MTEPICTTAVALDSSTATVRTREAAIGNLFADAMRAGMHADAAIFNGGGIRAGKTYEPGARISQGDVLAELPFNNRIVVLEITGARPEARDGERAVAPAAVRAGRFPQVSGMRSRSSSRASRAAASCRCRSAARRSMRARPIGLRSLDFLARGGDDYTMFRDASRITPDNDAPMMVNEVVEYLRSSGRRDRVSRGGWRRSSSSSSTGRSSAITLPSFGSVPGATSFTAPLSFVTDCNVSATVCSHPALGVAHSARAHGILLALARDGEAHAPELRKARATSATCSGRTNMPFTLVV